MGRYSSQYIPAFHFRFLTRFYDYIMSHTLKERLMKERLTELVELKEGERLLDLGCGTATLTIMLKLREPRAEITGFDSDKEILEIARRKISEAGVNVALDVGTATNLPYPDAAFNVVVASLMLHHLKTEDKKKALSEIYRVLPMEGRLFVMDLDKPLGFPMFLISRVIMHLEEASDNVRGFIPLFMSEAGFEVVSLATFSTLYGTISIFCARKKL